MLELTENQMYQVDGGAIKWGIIAGIGAVFSFFVGIIDGYTNPIRCR